MLSGRLRRTSSEDIGDELEIVSNDSGVRLIETKIPITLSHFLDHQLKETSEESEAQLVFCCNLLLADILFKENFFQKWANVHKDIVSKSNSPKNPFFYFPNLKKGGCKTADIPNSSDQIKNNDHTVIFKITDENLCSLDKESDKKLTLAHVEEVERELELIDKSTHEGSRGSWDDLGASEVDFGQGNKPDRVTYWIGSISDDGVEVAIPSTFGLNIIVSVPT
ncbi:hypothetical protein Q3G72_018194 [Acer saccharum]|nr:hypothetical protein Q3G72_018194 [Acer saccharum]